MNWDISLAQLAFIYTPGLLWAYIDRTHGYDRDATLGFFLIKVHLFGTLTYIVSFLLLLIPWVIAFVISLYIEFKILKFVEPFYFWIVISISVLASLMLARLYLKLNRSQFFKNYLKEHGAFIDNTNDELWDYAVNDVAKENGQINIIDNEEKLKYSGIHVSSTRDAGTREIFLKEAIVSDFEENIITKAKFIHIQRPVEKIRLEFLDSDIDYENQENLTEDIS